MSARHVLRRAHTGLPAILLGTSFNVLDAVSTGLLIFPSDGTAFSGLQNKSMSTYIMSTLLSQVVMTMGGSIFPGVLGAMLIEVLPFMRGVASDIRDALGDSNPSVVPTVMVAYALSSFLIGIIFIGIGCLGLGRLVSYFPQTVLTGAVGGIGVSLFILGLELPLPKDQTLTTSNAASVLFSHEHIPLLMASAIPIFFLCFSVRSAFLSRLTRGAVENPYYVPIYILMIGVVFWIIIGILGLSKIGGLSALAEKGWLFSTGDGLTAAQSQSLTESLNYWSLFDFRLVKLSALKHAVVNFVLLVVIGVLNLPLYVPALALALDVPYSMNHELIGQGAANILAGACGSVPNILQLSYSVFFTRAGGKRVEAAIVTLFTAVLYVVSSKLIRYIPTVLASGLVLFLGIELALEAIWESAKYLVWSEWLVVMTTLLACTFLGFAPGVGVGICAAFVVYTGWGCFDLRAQKQDIPERTTSAQHRYHRLLYPSLERSSLDGVGRYSRVYSLAAVSEEDGICQGSQLEEKPSHKVGNEVKPDIKIVTLDGYIFFGVIPSIESAIPTSTSVNQDQKYIIVDLERAYRVETAAARLIRTKARDTAETTIMVCGLNEKSGVAADLRRSGVELCFAPGTSFKDLPSTEAIPAFRDCSSAAQWCRFDTAYRSSNSIGGTLTAIDSKKSSQTATCEFLTLFGSNALGLQLNDSASLKKADPKVRVFQAPHTAIPRPTPDPNTFHLFCLVSGTVDFINTEQIETEDIAADHPRPMPARYNRESVLRVCTTTVRYVVSQTTHWTMRVKRRLGNDSESPTTRDPEPNSPASTVLDPSDTDVEGDICTRAGRVVAGDVIIVPPRPIPGTARVVSNPVPTADNSPRFKIWPVDSAAVALERRSASSCRVSLQPGGGGRCRPDPAWMVEIVSSGGSVTSQESVEKVCRDAIRQAVLQLGDGHCGS